MARLARKNIKVFAGNATNNGVFGSLKAENPVTTTNVEQIQSLPAWSAGWNSATMTGEQLPPLEEFQGIQYVTTYQQAYLMQEGMPEWASNVTYYKGSLAKEVTSNGFRIYCSLSDENENHLLSDTSNWKKVMDSSDLYAYDSAVVHLAGTETITGAKTFTNGYKSNISVMYNDNITKGTAPSSNSQYINMYMVGDSRTSGDSNALGLFRTYVTTSNIVYSTMQAFKNVASSGASSALRTYYNTAQNKFGVELQALSTGTDTNESMSLSTNATDSARIPTMGWVNNPATSTNVVHRSGNETIAGNKTFSGATTFTEDVNITGDASVHVTRTVSGLDYSGFLVQNTSLTKGTAPSTSCGGQWLFQAKDGINEANRIGGVFSRVRASGETTNPGAYETVISAYKPEASSTAHADIRVIYPTSGDAYTYAPTPSSSSDHSTKIATTDWCQTAFANAIGTPRDVTILWGNGTGTGSPTEFSLSEKFTNFEQIGFVCSTDGGGGREMCIQSTYWLNWLLSNSGNNSVVLGHGGQSNFYIKSYTASSNPSTNTKFKVEYEDGIAYYIFGINRKVKTVTNPLA